MAALGVKGKVGCPGCRVCGDLDPIPLGRYDAAVNSGLHAEVHYLNEYLALRGSQRWLQLAVNRCPNVLDEAVAKAIDLDQGETIEWVSPLESDSFIEYRDQAFLERLSISPQHRPLEEFWPRRGPVWDGLARTSGGRCLLIEAKANIPEFDSSSTRASEEPLRKIRQAFDETRTFLGVSADTDWSKVLLPVRQQAGASLLSEGVEQGRCRPGVRLLPR